MNRLFLLPLAFVCLQAQSPVEPSPWVSLLVAPDVGVDLRFRAELTPEGVYLRYWNLGKQAVHFDFYLAGAQSPEDAITQGRVQLDVGRKAGPFLIRTTAGVLLAPTLLRIRLGSDNDAYWRE